MSGFLGVGWSFPPRFEPDGRVAMSEDEQDIEESLRILFATRRGERMLDPRYGLDMHELLFDPISTTLRSLLEERVKVAVLLYEPRIEPLALRVASPEAESGVLRIELEYRVRATNSRYNLVLPFYDDRDSNESVRSAARALSWTTSKP